MRRRLPALAAGAQRRAAAVSPIDPVWVFLVGGRFAAKTLINGYWISLDFLGFSRPNRDLSMGYEDLIEKFFSLAFLSSHQRRRTNSSFGNAQLLMGEA
jgi:hypothetical protein